MKNKFKLMEALNKNYSSYSERKNCLPQFLGLIDDIAHAISKGWNLRTIWQVLHDAQKFEASYNCFTVYVRKYLYQKRLSVKIPSQISDEELSSKIKPQIGQGKSVVSAIAQSPAPGDEPPKAETALSVKISPQNAGAEHEEQLSVKNQPQNELPRPSPDSGQKQAPTKTGRVFVHRNIVTDEDRKRFYGD